ncbi:MAG TPA: hypothetical protein VH475_08825 [Tepidisphaeraceae bacterium]|jgi:hypothetical protein
MAAIQRAGIPVVPNSSRVRGTIASVAPDPSGTGRILNLTVDAADDDGASPNFARSYVGQTIHVYVPPSASLDLATRDRVEARVTYRGDEHGGSFALMGGDARKL